MSLGADGLPTRSTVTHVRTQTEQPWAGWSPDEVVRFIEAQASPAVTPPPVPTVRTTAPAATRATASSRDHAVAFDVGNVIGGRRRSIDLVVSTTKVSPRAEFEYRATLAGRPYGQASSTGPAWTNLATRTRARPATRTPAAPVRGGRAPCGHPAPEVELMLRPQSPTRRAPTLELG